MVILLSSMRCKTRISQTIVLGLTLLIMAAAPQQQGGLATATPTACFPHSASFLSQRHSLPRVEGSCLIEPDLHAPYQLLWRHATVIATQEYVEREAWVCLLLRGCSLGVDVGEHVSGLVDSQSTLS
jgi:hypothetical protein